MAKRVVILPGGADCILLAGAYRRFSKHAQESTIAPLNEHGMTDIDARTDHLYVTTHGFPSLLLGVTEKDYENIAKRLAGAQSVKITLDVCFSAAERLGESVGVQMFRAIRKVDASIQIKVVASEGPVIPGWQEKRGYVAADAVDLLNVIQNYLSQEKHYATISRAKAVTDEWKDRFEFQNALGTTKAAEHVSKLTAPFFEDLSRYVLRGDALGDKDLADLAVWITKSGAKDEQKLLAQLGNTGLGPGQVKERLKALWNRNLLDHGAKKVINQAVIDGLDALLV